MATKKPERSTIERLCTTARVVTAETGRWVADRHRHTQKIATRSKSLGDYVTQIDLRAEQRLARALRERHPDHGFLGEETGAADPDADFGWVVDPIDGTSNFANSLRSFGVAVACLHHGQPVAAALWCEPEGALYSAGLARGAFRNRSRIRMPRARIDASGLVGLQWFRGPRDLAYLPALLETGVRIRNFGASVIHLCDTAMGRLDANIQEQGKIWDIAAGGLIVTEAGGRFTDWNGRNLFPFRNLDGSTHYPNMAATAAAITRLRKILP